jgi:hypothetical protein
MTDRIVDDEIAAEEGAEELRQALALVKRRSEVVVRLVRPGLVQVQAGKIDVSLGAADVPWLEAAVALLRGGRR